MILVNKITEMGMTAQPNSEKVSYADLVRVVCNTPVQGGYALSDIRTRIAIMGVCEKAKADEQLKFERADGDYLKGIVKNHRWAAIHQALIDFSNDIEKMK